MSKSIKLSSSPDLGTAVASSKRLRLGNLGYLLCHLFFFELPGIVEEKLLQGLLSPNPCALVFGLYSQGRPPAVRHNAAPQSNLTMRPHKKMCLAESGLLRQNLLVGVDSFKTHHQSATTLKPVTSFNAVVDHCIMLPWRC